MKKIIFILTIISICLISINTTKAYTIEQTGHKDIMSIDFKNLEDKLLIQYSEKELEKAYSKVKKIAFGWSAYTMQENTKATYISEVILAKSNRTAQTITYKYTLKEGEQVDKETSTSGTISTKVSGKVKGISAQLDADIEKSWTTKTKTYIEERTEFKIDIAPNKKIELRVTGDCKIANGVGKYFFLGICFKKGTWEYITKATEYYELYETSL